MFHLNGHLTRAAARRSLNLLGMLVLLLALAASAPAPALAAGSTAAVPTYQNPLPITIPSGGMVESCADPSIIRGQAPGDNYWYIYCTSDPLNGNDKNASGGFNFNLTPVIRSLDLIHFEYVGNALAARPAWAKPDSGIWAPDIRYFNGQYYLYYTVPDTQLGPTFSSAIGVATSSSPTGPFVDSGAPVVEPDPQGHWIFDPFILTDDSGQKYIFYGSYFGGVWARKLSADGLHSDPASAVAIAIPNRYEGTYIVKHGGYYYFFGSATNCCNGPLTGYSVFTARSQNPLGPYVDREGNTILAGRAGGDVALSMNGNKWVGPGHNAVFTDFAGQDWFLYHAVDSTSPYFDGAVGFTRRPVLMDPLQWVDGWPVVRGGLFISDTPQPAPAAQPGEVSNVKPETFVPQLPGEKIGGLSDEFNGSKLKSQWSWVRQPAAGTYGLNNGLFNFQTQAADLYVDSNNASVLLENTPKGDYIVETKFKLDLPPEGCCQNYVQAGLVIYGSDDNFIKLAHVSIWETRQTEWAKELAPVPDGYPRYGNSVVGAPGEWTWLRIAKQVSQATGEELYTAYTSQDGVHWVHGGTWTHALGSGAKIGLVSMGGSGFTASFDYVRVFLIGSSQNQQ